MMKNVTVYGADWCSDSNRTRKVLDDLGVEYDYIDIEADEQAAAWVREQNDGMERKPTLKIGKRVLSTPSDDELRSALKAEGVEGSTGTV